MEGTDAEVTNCMTGAGIRPAKLELDTVGAGTRTGTAGRVTGNAVVRNTGLGTVTGTTVRGTATEYAAAGSGGGRTGATLTSSEGLVRYPVVPAPSGPMIETISEGAAGRDASRGTLPTGLARLPAAGGTFELVDTGADTIDLSPAAPPCTGLASSTSSVSSLSYERSESSSIVSNSLCLSLAAKIKSLIPRSSDIRSALTRSR